MSTKELQLQWILIQRVQDHIRDHSKNPASIDRAVMREDWDALIPVELVEALQESLLLQFPGERDSERRDSALQSALLHFMQKGIFSFDPGKAGPGGLQSYLGKSAYRLMIKLREQERTGLRLNQVTEFSVEDLPGPDELNDFETKEWFEWLQSQLTSEERLVLRLRVVDELKFAEIAERIGIPPSTAHDTWQRLRKKCHERERGDYSND